MNVFIPGHDTISILLSNIFFLLTRHHSAFATLRTEADVAPSPLTLNSLKRLPYLQAIIAETLRLHPPVGNMTRIALRDTILPTGGGTSGDSPVFVKRDTVVSAGWHELHRRRDVFGDDADEFRPERWENARPGAWSYMPFGGGQRACPGQELARVEVAYTVVRICRAFKAVERRDEVWEYVPSYKLVTESKRGVQVALLPA